MQLDELIAAARGETRADLLLKNARVVNVFSGEIQSGHVAVAKDRIVGIGEYDAARIIDLKGAYLTPGFIDGHVHLESSMVTVPEYAKAVVPNGTTAVVADPHEIANVLGDEGIRYVIDASKDSPLDVFVMVPSCVPATHLETSGARLNAEDIVAFLHYPEVLGLAEMMNFPGVLLRAPDVLEKIKVASGRLVDGHAPGLTGRDLAAYAAAGIRSDHECTTAEEALEKVRLGITVMIREGTAAKNLEALLGAVRPENSHRFLFCTDDRHPADLLAEGHLNFMIRKAVERGMDPALAVRLATLNPALYFGLKDRGAVAPGYRADLAAFDDFDAMRVRLVLKDGRIVSKDGEWTDTGRAPAAGAARPSVRIAPIDVTKFQIPSRGKTRVRVIGIVPNQIVTKSAVLDAAVTGGMAVSDVRRDVLKIAVVERHKATGNIGLGFVKGFGLKKGALASSVAHDSHNIIVVATNDADMLAAVKTIADMQGGLVAVADGKTVECLPLPVAGLLSEEPLETVRQRIEALKKAAKTLGCVLDDPFMHLSFLALPVIPELKITDKGLVDVGKFDIVPLWE